jgi:site-specific recombinase XerD
LLVSKDGRPEIRLRLEDIEKVKQAAREKSPRDYLIFRLCGDGRGLRIGEVVGFPPKKVRYMITKNIERPDSSVIVKKETVEKTYSKPGIKKRDLRERGVIVNRKGKGPVLVALDSALMQELRQYADPFKPEEKLFPVSEQQFYRACQSYAKVAGLEDWDRAHPHRWRHYFIDLQVERFKGDSFKIKILSGHSAVSNVEKYVHAHTPEEERALLEGTLPA